MRIPTMCLCMTRSPEASAQSPQTYCLFRKAYLSQGLHRLEKCLNLESFLEKSLKIKYALKSPRFLLFYVGINTVDRDLNQNKAVVPLFGAANAAPNKSLTILY